MGKEEESHDDGDDVAVVLDNHIPGPDTGLATTSSSTPN